MCLDICPPAGVTARELAEAVRRTTALGGRAQRDAPRAPGQLRFGIAQGGTDPELPHALDRGDRRACPSTATRSAASRSGRSRADDARHRRLGGAAAARPEQPRYFMGLGDPEGILEVIARGHRHVRLRPADPDRPHGSALTLGGPPQPPQRPLRARPGPLDDGCDCPACARVLPRVRPPPREPAGAARAAAAHTA